MQPIRFYRTKGTYGCFSNFSRHPVEMKGKVWPTSEHYFQAQKFAGTVYEELIQTAPSAMEAARMGRNPAWPLRPEWDRVRDEVMREVLLAKFTQHTDAQAILLSTGDALIIEAAPHDYYWGEGADGSGANRLGLLLMEVRAALEIRSRGANFRF